MLNSDTTERLKRFEIPGRLTVLEGNGELPKLEVISDWSSAEIYLHGAHVTDFRKNGEPPLLFTSQFSRFSPDHPIRGGIPIIFPWFGAREGGPAHGFARTASWELHEVTTVPDGGVSLRFGFPGGGESELWSSFAANYVVTVTEALSVELILTNTSGDQELNFENCLHAYFSIQDINTVFVKGLKGVSYLDKVDHFAPKTEGSDAIEIASEVDRIYYDTTDAVEVLDPGLQRRIRIEKSGSASTVLWNPWLTKAQQMSDFGGEEYQQMICVESGNVAKNKLALPPGKTSVLKVVLSSGKL